MNDPTQAENLTRSSFAAMAGVLISRFSGVFRTIIVNATFGAATALDAFNAAFRFPNALRDLFADGALSAAFMTALVDIKKQGIEEERKLISIVLGFFGSLTFLLAFLGAYYAEPFIRLITDERFAHSGGLAVAVSLFRILAFYLPVTMLNAVIMAILGVLGKSFRAMNGSIFLSIGMIAGALLFSPFMLTLGYSGIIGLAIGAMLGALMQMLYQMQPILTLKLLPLPNFNPFVWFQYKPLHKILLQMAPRSLGQGALTIALAVNTYFATQIGSGVLTYIVTAVIIIQVPIGLFGVATGFAALPILTALIRDGEISKFSESLTNSLRITCWLASLTTIAMVLLIVPFYVVLFQHGKIVFHDTILNSIAICSYAIGIIFASGSKVLINSLYVLNATRQIIYNAFAYLLVNATLSALLAPRFGVVGLGVSFGLATAVDFWLNYLFIAKIFRRKYQQNPYTGEDPKITFKLSLLTFSSFIIGLTGVALIKNVWQPFPTIFGVSLNFWLASLILVSGSVIISVLFSLMIWYFGPLPLKNLLAGIIRPFMRKNKVEVVAKNDLN